MTEYEIKVTGIPKFNPNKFKNDSKPKTKTAKTKK